MKEHVIIGIATLFLLFSCTDGRQKSTEEQQDFTKYVDPQIGSVHGRWFFYTPAALPFGMAKLAPHTNSFGSEGGWGPVGYDDRHESIEGFGFFHEFQIGGLIQMPTTGPLITTPGTLDDPQSGFRSRFDKRSENAMPGYYEVELADYQIKVELSATKRTGFTRYTYLDHAEAHLLIDVGHQQGESGEVIEAYAEVVNDTTITGKIETYPEYAKFCDPGKHVTMYFYMVLSQAPISCGTYVDDHINNKACLTRGKNNGLYLTFKLSDDNTITTKTGLSYTSIENAKNNLIKETSGKSFGQVKNEATQAWNSVLGKISVKDNNEDKKKKFYTALYHSLLGRGIAHDVNGDYPLVGNQVGHTPIDKNSLPLYSHYNTDGMWGGYWNLSQLWSLVYPKTMSDYLQSNIDFYKDRNWLHDGAATGVFTNGVQTNFQGLLLASAYHCGIRDFDIKKGYEAALKNELVSSGRNLGNGKYDLHYFINDKYIPYQDTTISNGWVFNFGASHTLEYSFSSYAVGEWAKVLGDNKNASKLMEQAGYYKNLLDQKSKMVRPKYKNGEFLSPFDPMKAWDGFQEGNAAQFTWFVPHDINGLIDFMGIDTFNARLEKVFEDAAKTGFGSKTEEVHSFSGIEKLYNHGNQPCLHNAWLFNYSGKPWLTQKWVQRIGQEFYGLNPLHGYGVGQDEDQGQLGGWYVLAAMGLFDVQGHSRAKPTFQLSSPFFDKISIALNPEYYPGRKLIISTRRESADDIYIQSATFNGKSITNCWISRNELIKGGELTFYMGPLPNKEWGVETPPPSMSGDQ